MVLKRELEKQNIPVAKKETAAADNMFFAEIGELLQKARNTAYQAVNTIMVTTYWQIGKRIVEQEQHGQNRANYGDFLITNLSRYLSDTLGKGFSEANLKNIRQFYTVFPEFDQFATHCVANLSWTNIRMIMRLDSQMRISTETSHFYVDLVFYNYLLKCFVIIDLKTNKLTHADIGQMDMYV